jgi:hypothetical protein
VYIVSIFGQNKFYVIICKANAPVLLLWLCMLQTDDFDILCTLHESTV